MNESRRQFLKSVALSTPALGTLAPRLLHAAETASDDALPPIRQITNGPQFHWFGYYDKLQFSPDDRFVLGNQVDFEGRTPTPDDVIQVGMIDTHDGDKWIELGETRAWCWQQGCMLQWIPGSKNEIIWNDRDGDHFVSHILNVETKQKRTLPHPIYNISPDGKSAITLSFSRLHDTAAAATATPAFPIRTKPLRRPKEIGLWSVDLQTGDQKLLFSIAEAAAISLRRRPARRPSRTRRPATGSNTCCSTPMARRFFFLHRWQLRQGRLRHAGVHDQRRRHGPVHPRPLRLHVPLHLARPDARDGLGLAPVAQRRVSTCTPTTRISSNQWAKA